MTRFEIVGDEFLLDGEPYRVLSGALHYFRVRPDEWADRIHKAKLMGLNTIETYVAWNAHEPREGHWVMDGSLDLVRFLKLIAAEGMHAIVRPGPYICAEWHNGGLPGWLVAKPGIGLRRYEPQYIAAVTTYLQRVLEEVRPLQIDSGGPVILVQIENEYGAYGHDSQYLEALVSLTRNAGITVPLTTVDQPEPDMLADGSLPGLLRTASFGSRARERLATLREYQPTGPLMCSEFWCGWFDHWGGPRHTTDAADAAQELDDMLAMGASVNFYMFHGGTNFGFTNGANDQGSYEPLVTSYDYDAPISEAGELTEKFWAFREVIARYASVPEAAAREPELAPAFNVTFEQTVCFGTALDSLNKTTTWDAPPTFDDLKYSGAFVVYSTTLSNVTEQPTLRFSDVRDRAQVYANSRLVGIVTRGDTEHTLTLPSGSYRLDILVEDQGRVNYGPKLGEPKGLVGQVSVNDVAVPQWQVNPVPLESVDWIRSLFANPMATPTSTEAGPFFARTVFDLSERRRLFLDTSTFAKGVAWLNGYNLGRYWNRGPQRTLHIPPSFTRTGENELIIFELERISTTEIQFVSSLQFGDIN